PVRGTFQLAVRRRDGVRTDDGDAAVDCRVQLACPRPLPARRCGLNQSRERVARRDDRPTPGAAPFKSVAQSPQMRSGERKTAARSTSFATDSQTFAVTRTAIGLLHKFSERKTWQPPRVAAGPRSPSGRPRGRDVILKY